MALFFEGLLGRRDTLQDQPTNYQESTMRSLIHRTAIAAAVSLFALGPASAATFSTGDYTVEYDDTTPFGSVAFASTAGNTETFGWRPSSNVATVNVGVGSSNATFTLPSFSLTANPGYALSGSLLGFFGALSFGEGFGGTASGSAEGAVTIDGNTTAIGGALSKDTLSSSSDVRSGYLHGDIALPYGPFTSLSFSNGSLTLSALGTAAQSFAFITSNPTQNELSVSFNVSAVPENRAAALMLCGLGMLGFVAFRRTTHKG